MIAHRRETLPLPSWCLSGMKTFIYYQINSRRLCANRWYWGAGVYRSGDDGELPLKRTPSALGRRLWVSKMRATFLCGLALVFPWRD